MNGENVIGNPHHVRTVGLKQPFHLVHDFFRFTAPVRLSEYLVTAPTAVIWTTSRRYERKRSLAMRTAPSVHVPRNVYRVPGRPGQRVDIGNVCPRAGLLQLS